MNNQRKIIIIGAGMAGLAAARKLLSQHFEVTVLEAKDRIGGRTWTDYSLGVPFDLGAFIIHGIDKNPMTDLAREHQAKIIPINLHNVFFSNSAKPITPAELKIAETEYNHLVDQAITFAQQAKADMSFSEALQTIYQSGAYPKLEKRFYAWKNLGLSFYTGANLKNLSARHFSEDETVLEGGNYFVLSGYKTIVEGLAKSIPIFLNTKVTKINYSGKQVKIESTNGNFEADAVIITVPLGVLREDSITFNPALPLFKREAVQKLQMGVLDKIALRFPHDFWPCKERTITYFADAYNTFPWFINYHSLYEQPILVGVLNADLAREFEKLDDKTIGHEAMTVLKKIFGSNIPDPIKATITRWADDACAHGSYVYLPVGSNGEAYDALAQPIDNKLFFAGEATSRNFSATTHGAYFSGEREAERIINLKP